MANSPTARDCTSGLASALFMTSSYIDTRWSTPYTARFSTGYVARPSYQLSIVDSSKPFYKNQCFQILLNPLIFFAATLDNGIGFYMQTDGSFVVYDNSDTAAADAVWNSKTGKYDCGSGNCRVVWQIDGNLVVYVHGGTVAWSSNTAGKGNRLYLSNQQPYVTIYGSNRNTVWSTPHSVNGGGDGPVIGGGGGGGVDPCSFDPCVVVPDPLNRLSAIGK